MNTFPWKVSGSLVEVSGFDGRKSMHFESLDVNPWLGRLITQFAESYPNTPLIQDSALGALTADEREFLISGCLRDEWDELFPEEA